MSEKWTDKNTGFRTQVPHNSTALQIKNWLHENLGNLSFSRLESNDDKDNVTVKTFGNFQKILYDPSKKGEDYTTYEDAVEIVIGDPIELTDFITVADNLIANYQQLISFADYAKNTFIPQLLSYYDTWVGNIATYTWIGGILHVDSYWAETDVYNYKKAYLDWMNSTAGDGGNEGYNTFIAVPEQNILILTALKLIVSYIAVVITQEGFSVKTYGMKTLGKGLSGTQGLVGSSIWIDVKMVSPVTGFKIDPSDTTYIRNMKRKVAAEGTYGTYRTGKPLEKPYYCWTYNNGSCGTLGTYGTSGWSSPEEHLEILVYANMGWTKLELINLKVEFKGAIRKTDAAGSGGNTFYLVARNPEASAFGAGFGSWPPRQTLNFDINFGQSNTNGTSGSSGTAGANSIDLIKYPPEINYLVYEQPNAKRNQLGFYTTAGSHGTDGTLSISLKGYATKTAENFGGSITSITISSIYDKYITNYGGITFSAHEYADSFCKQFIHKMYQPGYDDLDTDYDVYFNIQSALYNFSLFAALYYDHPVVTGVDIYTPKGSYPSSDLTEVNNYVNSKYTYVPDRSLGYSSDCWVILTEVDIGGDCEDFALTKLQKLLEYGWPISKLHLESGVKLDEYGNRSAHAWLVAESDDGVYVLDNGSVSHSLTTREAMQAVFNKKNIYQISGMTWQAVTSGELQTVEKPNTIPIDSKLLAFKARFIRRYREEGSRI
jgi:hypothetical protein